MSVYDAIVDAVRQHMYKTMKTNKVINASKIR